VRVLLDAHLSGKRLGGLLARRGHDVLALADDPTLAPLSDEAVLALATAEGRVLVTRNSKDFAPILRRWAEGARSHAGCVLLWSVDHHEHARIAKQLERLFAERPRQAAWRNISISI
jgi:predicted nuclease of predicted toxin-antitoxin system